MLTVLNAADQREIIVIALTEITGATARQLIGIDAAERGNNPLDEIIEPVIERTFGVLIAEDDFSADGPIAYTPARVNRVQRDLVQVARDIRQAESLLTQLQNGSSVEGAEEDK